MAHGGWPGGPGSSSSWRRLLRLSRLANGSSPFPAPRPRALLWPPSAPRDRPNWFLCSGMVPPVSLRQLRQRRTAGTGGGPSLCPSRGRRESGRRASAQTDAAQVEPCALRAPRRQVGPRPRPPPRGSRDLVALSSPSARVSPRAAFATPPAPRRFPAALVCPGPHPGSVTAPARKAGGAPAPRN